MSVRTLTTDDELLEAAEWCRDRAEFAECQTCGRTLATCRQAGDLPIYLHSIDGPYCAKCYTPEEADMTKKIDWAEEHDGKQLWEIARELLTPYWQNEEHGLRIFCGDCIEVMPQLERESVTLLWTDPPYGHNNLDSDLQAARVRDQVAGGRRKACEPIANDGAEDMRSVVNEALKRAVPLLRPDCCCCCCCCGGGGGPKPTFAWTAERMDRDGLDFFHAVVWDKSKRGNGMGWRYRRNYEFVMVAHRTGGSLAWANPDVAVPNVVDIAPPRKRLHPNEKPLALVENFIRLHTQRGDTVLDPFLGSGTTLVAAYRLGREATGIEISEEYCELAAERLERELAQGRLFEPQEIAAPEQQALALGGS